MSEGALGLIRRVTTSNESAIYTDAADYKHIAGIEDLSFTHPREVLVDNRHLVLAKGQYASHLGAKSGEISFSVPVHAATYDDMEHALKAAFGTLSANTITHSTANTTTLTKSAGTFDPIVLTTISGVEVPRPIKSISGDVATYAILPGGSASASLNAGQAGGACFIQDYTADATTLHIEVDADGESDFVPYTFTGCVPTRCEINLDLSNRLMMNWTFTAGDFTANSAANAADPAP